MKIHINSDNESEMLTIEIINDSKLETIFNGNFWDFDLRGGKELKKFLEKLGHEVDLRFDNYDA